MELQDIENLVQGAASIQRTDDWVKPWRILYDQMRLFPAGDDIIDGVGTGAGVRLRFATDSPRLELEVLPISEAARLFDITCQSELLQTVPLNTSETVVVFEDLPAGENVYEIWLPQALPTSIRGLRVVAGSTLWAVPDDRPKWVTYGSSITHCSAAHSPARTWPAVVARERNLSLTCLGYGGNCHCDPMMARMIRDMDTDLITLKVGINIQGGASLSGRTVKPAVIGLVMIIREKHPDTQIAVISPIISPPREDQPNVVGMSLSSMRAHIRDAVQRLRDCGDENLYYFDGKEIFGEDLVSYLPDLLHPDGDGYEVLAHRISEIVFGSRPFERVVAGLLKLA